VFIKIGEYDQALESAREFYYRESGNIYLAQAYFNCLIRTKHYPYPVEVKEELRKIYESFSKSSQSITIEIYLGMKSMFECYVEGNFKNAKSVVDRAISENPGSVYPLLTKFEICDKNKDIDGMQEVLGQIESLIDEDSILKSKVIECRVYLRAHLGRKSEAMKIIDDEMQDVPDLVRDRVRAKAKSL
jgi:tetratricopeptide (TPR) repeat protein